MCEENRPLLSNSVNLSRVRLPSEEALRVKAAEFWLRLGEVNEALKELGSRD
jgi:hypothetical protein